MDIERYPLAPPTLDELVSVIQPALKSNYASSSISVAECPDLTQPPFHFAASGLCGRELIMDIGGQPNLFPDPRLEAKYDMSECARAVGMSRDKGMCIGAGAGPYHSLKINSELAPNFSWTEGNSINKTYYTKISNSKPICEKSPNTDCALMMNVYGSDGLPGQVLKIVARGRKGQQKSFTECIRQSIAAHYGDTTVSLGGVFVVKAGKTKYHVMRDFPPKKGKYTFSTGKELYDWLTFHDFDSSANSPIVCLTVFHSADPGQKMDLRMEHTHCFTTDGSNRGGHYHHDLEGEEVEYEAYLNTAKVIYRVDRPEVTLKRY